MFLHVMGPHVKSMGPYHFIQFTKVIALGSVEKHLWGQEVVQERSINVKLAWPSSLANLWHLTLLYPEVLICKIRKRMT